LFPSLTNLLDIHKYAKFYVKGLRGKVLVAQGAIQVASGRSCKKLPPCLIKPVLAGSKMDPLLAKAKPTSDGGSASVITQLRRGRKKLR